MSIRAQDRRVKFIEQKAAIENLRIGDNLDTQLRVDWEEDEGRERHLRGW